MNAFQDLPFETNRSDEYGYDVFHNVIWHNAEVCNACFSQVRNIGPELERWMGASYMTMNEWYERTESGSQEHTDWDHNTRYGTCFCLECGHDCNGSHADTPLSDLLPLLKNIHSYVTHHTDYSVRPKRFVTEVCKLKREPAAQSLETEVMAIAFSRALKHPSHAAGQAQATAD